MWFVLIKGHGSKHYKTIAHAIFLHIRAPLKNEKYDKNITQKDCVNYTISSR